MNTKISKKAQEEIVGFAMIIIVVAVIILILLGISIKNPTSQEVESYEVESFIQASLQHTTECSTDYGFSYNNVQDLITNCWFGQTCADGKDTCIVLNSTIKNMLEQTWKIGKSAPVKGYALNITSKDKNMLFVNEGNITNNYKGNAQELTKRGTRFSIELKVYY